MAIGVENALNVYYQILQIVEKRYFGEMHGGQKESILMV